ncbi:MAG: peptidoglycan recognition family protein, partial [Bacteroidetes bacterium]|nr:peptidoglycan recognition family protein [Bacteroidota bacterium]
MRRSLRPGFGWALCLLFLFHAPALQAQVLGDLVDVRVDVEDLATVQTGKQRSVGAGGLLPFAEVTGIAVEIGLDTDDVTVSFRFLDGPDAVRWVDLYVVPSATGGTAVAGWRQDLPFEASRFEIRVTGPPGAQLEIRDVGFFDARSGEETPPSTDPQPLMGAKTGTIVPPPLVTRAQWNARPFIGSPSALARPTYDFMTWHHAAGYSAENLDQGKAQMRAMQDLHQNVRGWSDIGYQFAIDRAGNLYQGRPFMDNSTSLSQVPVLALGAHAGGANTGNIGVVIMGCYHPPEGANCQQEITPAAFATYINLFAFLSERYGVEPEMIRGHRDFGQTACP